MQGSPHPKRIRKGAKSCAECRRRKVRCTRVPEDAQTCQNCVERGTECIEQTLSVPLRQTHQFSSRQRISHLETKLASLSKTVRDIEAKLGYQRDPTPERSPSHDNPDSDSEDGSSISDSLIGDQPSHLRSLFQNEWLSMDTNRQSALRSQSKARANAHLLDSAREALQMLIPSKAEVSDVSRSACNFLTLLHKILPQPFTFKTYQEIVQAYDSMLDPEVEVISLASWMVMLALAAFQISRETGSPASTSKENTGWIGFSRAVSDTIENKLLLHDALICNIQGLGMAVHFVRLQLSKGNFRKAWVRLRHVITLAELIGLPTAYKFRTKVSSDEETQLQKIQIWEVICAADRLSGMILNLPIGTMQYEQTIYGPLMVDGVVQTNVYMIRLTNIAAEIQRLDELNVMQDFSSELYVFAIGLAKKLKELASEAPKSWWTDSVKRGASATPDCVVQFLHFCMVMRLHLPITMRQDSGEEYIYSRLACIDACESVAQRYRILRQLLPSGFFLARLLDLQAFTASVVLLLISHGSSTTDRLNTLINKDKIDGVVTDIVELLAQISKEAPSSGFAQSGASTIRSLMKLLQQNGNPDCNQKLTLDVPLLGKVHIQRNTRVPVGLIANQAPGHHLEQNINYGNAQTGYTMYEHMNLDSFGQGATLQNSEQLPWDPFLWSVETNYENYFQDALMAENFN